jgi:tetratricopeptide (TPR) repeat protein
LGTGDLEDALEKLSLEKTEGIPFFIEEFVRSLKDLRLAVRKAEKYCLVKDFQEMTVPSTIQDIIMARVDALPKDAKDILQTGSVIEREFSLKLLRQVTNITENDLLSHLAVLKDNDLLYERGVFPESSYIFKHALTRKVLYDSILTRKKQILHETIGNAIEVLFKDSPEKHYGVLTEHFIASGNYKKGALYSRLAERYAEKAASLADAMDYAQKRIDCLEKLPPTQSMQKEIIDARTVLGLYAVQSGFHARANEAVTPVVEMAEKLNYQRRLPQIYSIVGSYKYIVEEDFPAAFKNLEEALAISGKSNDMVSSLFSNFWLAIVRSVNCDFDKASIHMTRALEINQAANSNWGVSIIKSNLSYFIHYFTGSIKDSYQTSKEALEGANEGGDIFSKAMASVSHGISCYGRGFFDEAISYLTEGCKLCDKINLVIFHGLAHFWMGEANYELENFKDSEDDYQQAIAILEHNRIIPSWVNVIRSARIRMQAVGRKPEIDLDRLISYADGNRSRIWDGWLNRNIAEIMLFLDDQHLVSAEDWINKAIKADSTHGTMLNLGRNFTLHAGLYKRRGQHDNAATALKTAIEIFKKCESDGFLKLAENELASIG